MVGAVGTDAGLDEASASQDSLWLQAPSWGGWELFTDAGSEGDPGPGSPAEFLPYKVSSRAEGSSCHSLGKHLPSAKYVLLAVLGPGDRQAADNTDRLPAHRGMSSSVRLSSVIFCSPMETPLRNHNIHTGSMPTFTSFMATSQTCIT